MNDLVLDASLALRWFLEDETDRKYSLGILASRHLAEAVRWFLDALGDVPPPLHQ